MATPDAAFDAAVHTMLDAHYQIMSSDRRGGNLSGTRTGANRRVFFPQPHHVTLSIRIDGEGNRSTVRANTLVNGESALDEQALSEFFQLLDRRQTLYEPSGGAP